MRYKLAGYYWDSLEMSVTVVFVNRQNQNPVIIKFHPDNPCGRNAFEDLVEILQGESRFSWDSQELYGVICRHYASGLKDLRAFVADVRKCLRF